MRRKDREMSRKFGLEIIDKSVFGVLSMLDENDEIYGVPLSIVRDGNVLYFHSAIDGRKVRALEKNPNVSIAFVGDVQVPDAYSNEELDEILKDESKASLLGDEVFTTEFESAIVKGRVQIIEDRDKKIEVLRLICQKYTPTKMAYFDRAVDTDLKGANIYRIEIDDIKAKRKKL